MTPGAGTDVARHIGPDDVLLAERLDKPVTQRGVVASEWLTFRSLRSTLLVLGAAVLGMVAWVGAGPVVAALTLNRKDA